MAMIIPAAAPAASPPPGLSSGIDASASPKRDKTIDRETDRENTAADSAPITSSVAAEQKTADEAAPADFNAWMAVLLTGMPVPQQPANTQTPISFAGAANVDPGLLLFQDGMPLTAMPGSTGADGATLTPDILRAMTPGVPSGLPPVAVTVNGEGLSIADPRLIATPLSPQDMASFQDHLKSLASPAASPKQSETAATIAVISFEPAPAAPSLPIAASAPSSAAPAVASAITATPTATVITPTASAAIQSLDPLPEGAVIIAAASAAPVTSADNRGAQKSSPSAAAIVTLMTAEQPDAATPMTPTSPAPSAETTSSMPAPAKPAAAESADPYESMYSRAKYTYDDANAPAIRPQQSSATDSAPIRGQMAASASNTAPSIKPADTMLSSDDLMLADLAPDSLAPVPYGPAGAASGPGAATLASLPLLNQPHATMSHPATQMLASALQKSSTGNGPKTLSVELDPPELGRVHIDVKIESDHPMTVTMVVEKPETYGLLRRDAHMLEQALAGMGLNGDGVSINLSLSQDQGSFGQTLAQMADDKSTNNGRAGLSADAEITADTPAQQASVDWFTDGSGRLRYNLMA